MLHDVIATALHGCSDRRLCVLTTCESPAALHSALAGPRLWGTVETLAAPDRDGRAALLAVLLAGAVQGDRGYNSKRGCDCAGNSECECDSDCDDLTTLVDMLALRTDGYVASDLSAVVAAARQAVAVTDFSAASSTASNGLQRMELLAAALETALATHSPLHLSSLGATRVQVTLEVSCMLLLWPTTSLSFFLLIFFCLRSSVASLGCALPYKDSTFNLPLHCVSLLHDTTRLPNVRYSSL